MNDEETNAYTSPKKITSKIYYQRDSLLPATRLSTTRPRAIDALFSF